MAGEFNVKSYGAVGDGVANDRAAIQAAVDAAYAAGGGVVYLPPGTYGIGTDGLSKTVAGIQLKSGVTLQGDGAGVSTLMVLPGNNLDITGVVRTPFGEPVSNVTVANLTIDGNRDAQSGGKVDGFFCGTAPGSSLQVSDITVRGVHVKDCSGYGFDPHEQTLRLVMENCISSGNGLDGFTLDFLIDSTIRNNVAFDNDRHGFNVVTSTRNTLLEGNRAYDNGGNGITVQRGSEDIPTPYNVTIRGGEVYGNALSGVLIRYAHDIRVEGIFIHDNLREGVKIYGGSDNTVTGNRLENNSQAGHEAYNEIYVDNAPDSVTGRTWVADDNVLTDNTITATGEVRAAYGIKTAAGTTDTTISGNTISGMSRDAMLLQGATTGETGGETGGGGSGGETGSEDEVLTGGAGADSFNGGAGSDTLSGGGGQDILWGGDGADSILGGDAFDFLHGNRGQDTLHGGLGSDWVVGGQDGDVLSGGQGDDYIVGNLGADTAFGDLGADTILGGQADDRLYGRDGNDLLSGDRGADTLSGGAGADTFFVFRDAGVDRVTDFNRAEGDRILLAPGETYSVAQVGADVVVTVGSAQLVLAGVQQSTLTSGWIV